MGLMAEERCKVIGMCEKGNKKGLAIHGFSLG